MATTLNFKRYRLWILIGLAVAIGTAGFSLLLSPSLESFRLARQDMAQVKGEAQQASRRLTNLQAILAQGTLAAPAELEKLRAIFVAPPPAGVIAWTLARHAATAHFLLTTLEVGGSGAQAERAGALADIPIQAQFRGGGYDELKALLRLISSAVPLLDVTSYTFDPKSATVSMNLKAWRAPELSFTSVPLSENFFVQGSFKALQFPLPLPEIAPVGSADPFLPRDFSRETTP